MDAVWQELIRAVPWGAVIIVLRWLDIKEKEVERHEREANAKEKAQQDRENQIAISQGFANAINAIAKAQDISSVNITNAINELKTTLVEQYRNMGITQDIREKIDQLTKINDGRSHPND